jgi:chemotaxis response regulator CheB
VPRGIPDSPKARRTASGDGLVIVGDLHRRAPALERLLAPLPATFPWPIVIAQHMPASFTGPLARRLDASAPFECWRLRVRRAASRVALTSAAAMPM